MSALVAPSPLSTLPRALPGRARRRNYTPYILAFFVLGWVTFAFTLVDVGRYSIVLIYLAALPVCLRLTTRSVCFLVFPLLSTVTAILVAIAEGASSRMGSNAAQQALALLFAAGVAAIDWRRYWDVLGQILVLVAVPIVAFGGYQMMARVGHWPLAFLPVTNQQEYAMGGLQRGWEKPLFTRASSLFVEPSEFGYFCLWLVVFGLSAKHPRLRVAAFALAAAGILFSQSLSAVLGTVLLFGVYLLTNRISSNQVRQLGMLAVIAVAALVTVPQLMPRAFDRFSERIQQAATLDQRADSDRVNHIPQNWRTFCEAPVWGHGLANVATDDDQNGTSITYSLLLMERGAVGALLFLLPWFLTAFRGITLRPEDPGRSVALLLTTLNFFCFSTFATMYYLPFWFSLGICASLTLRTAATTRQR